MLRPGDHLLFQGDSLTDCGRREADGNAGLGQGYPALLAGMFAALRPELGLRISNRGVGGDRTTELLARWQTDCLDLRPDVLSIFVGTNDAWRKLIEWEGQTHVPPPLYADNLRRLVDSARAGGVRAFILMTPIACMPEDDHWLNQHVGEYADWLRGYAREIGATLVDCRSPTLAARRAQPDIPWSTDGCHPTAPGHGLIAAAWWQAVMGA